MFPEHITSLRTLLDTFSTEQSCLEYLEHRRWNGNITSPFIEDGPTWKCKNGKYICKNTNKYFTVKTGTIFEKTKIPIRDWFIAIWHMTSYKKGISSVQLATELGVTQSTAWYLASKIRRLYNIPSEEKLDGIIESDETFIGGKNKNRHKDKKVPMSQGRSFKDKTPILGLLQRNGDLRAFVIPNTQAKTLQPIIRKNVEKGSVFISDEWMGYNHLHSDFDHHVVDHAKKQYVDFDNPEIHSNSIEGFWSIMKRSYNGIYNWWSRKHMQYYVNEFVYRYNTRKTKATERFLLFLENIFVPLTYQDIRNTKCSF